MVHRQLEVLKRRGWQATLTRSKIVFTRCARAFRSKPSVPEVWRIDSAPQIHATRGSSFANFGIHCLPLQWVESTLYPIYPSEGRHPTCLNQENANNLGNNRRHTQNDNGAFPHEEIASILTGTRGLRQLKGIPPFLFVPFLRITKMFRHQWN